MGRGLSKQQREILIWTYENGGSAEISAMPSFGHERIEGKTVKYWTEERSIIKSDVERASVARAITRLCARGLSKRRYRQESNYSETSLLELTPEGLELAKELSAKLAESVD